MGSETFPLVSILIPYYNHNHFIRETLDSIIADSYPNKEIIIINDGSSNPDDSNITSWICDHQNDIAIQYIKRENLGISKTFNELTDLAKGKYLMPCASDDYFINNTITARVNLLESNPTKMIVIADNIVVNDNGEILYNSNLFEMRKGQKRNYLNNFLLKRELIIRWGLAGPSWLGHKDIFKTIGGLDENLIVEDWDFFLRAAAKNLIIFYDQPVSAYRLHDSNTINNPEKKKRMLEDLAKTAYQNIENFDSFYFKYLLRKKYFDIKTFVDRMDKNYIHPAKQLSLKENFAIVKQNHKQKAISNLEFLLALIKISKYSIRKKMSFRK